MELVAPYSLLQAARIFPGLCRPSPARLRTARGGILVRLPDGADIPRTSERNARPAVTAPNDDLRSRLSVLTLEDEHRLGRRLDGLRKVRDPQARERQRQRIAADVASAEARIDRRRAAVPTI